jgi:hypothetical protein
MFQTCKVPCLAFALLVVLLAYKAGQAACTQECRMIEQYCKVDGMGVCITSMNANLSECVKYENNLKSCWTCGKGQAGAQNGWCLDGDKKKKCVNKKPMTRIRVKYFYCINNCNAALKNTYLEALMNAGDMSTVKRKQDYHQCVIKQPGI